MRYLFMAFLFCLLSFIANAQVFQTQKPILCDTTKNIVESLSENWEERPIWLAKDEKDDSRYSLFVNAKTGSWTLIQFTKEYACILGVGVESTLVLKTSI